MYEVLIAVDDDEDRARRQAEAVASLPGTGEVRAHVFHVFTDNPSGASVTQHGPSRRVRERLEEAEIEVELHEEGGDDPAAEVVELAESLDVDAIYVGTRKRSPTGKALLGSTAQSVLLNTDRPVVVVGDPR